MPHDSLENTSATVESSDPRLWSHAALRTAELGLHIRGELESPAVRQAVAARDRADEAHHAGDADAEHLARDAAERMARLEDLSKPPSVLIWQPDGCMADLPAPDEAELDAWIFGGLPIRPDEVRERVRGERAEAVRKLYRSLVIRHRVERHASDPRDAEKMRQGIGRNLERMLTQGLENRLGQKLYGSEEHVYVYMTARGVRAPGLRVCEVCLLVFGAPRATRCSDCRHSPPRPSLRPWHDHVQLGDRAAGRWQQTQCVTNDNGTASFNFSVTSSRGPRVTTYRVTCAECGKQFDATSAAWRYCESCGAPDKRVRRHRAKQAGAARGG
jgi:ribosomal protein L37E